jgi:hypothetical protein
MHNNEHAAVSPTGGTATIPRLQLFLVHNGFLFIVIFLLATIYTSSAWGQVNGVGQRPDLGWGSFTQEVLYGESWESEAHVKAQSDALKSSGLQSHGYVFINLDSGWQNGFDEYGRPMVNTALFPDGLAATVQYIHSNGQKAGIYWVPGIQSPVYTSGDIIYGTSYSVSSIVDAGTPGNAFSYGSSCCNYWHMKIDFTKPGAQQYVSSVVALFASWGFDAIKLDGVTPGSDDDNLIVDNRAEVQAWSEAIAQSGRPMELTLSWKLDHNYLSTWQQYSNARRIEDDVNCYCVTETQWPEITRLFGDLETWQTNAGPALGWNDLDSLLVGSGAISGLSDDERQSTMTLWAISNSPIIIGDDLTQLDTLGQQLLGNDNVIAVDQSGAPAREITGGNNPVWASPELSNGTYNVALFNLNDGNATTTVAWNSLGVTGPVHVYDLWAGQDLGSFQDSYSAALNAHSSALLRITPSTVSQIPAAPTGLTATPGNGKVALTWTASTGASTYNIYRGSSSGSEILLSTGVTSAVYADNSAPNNTTYFYEVTAVNALGESAKSTEVSATPTAGFSISASSTSLSLTSTSAQPTSILTISPNDDARTLTFSCVSLPAAYVCEFSPSSVPLSGLSSPQSVTLTVSAQNASARANPGVRSRATVVMVASVIPSCLFMWVFLPCSFKKWRRTISVAFALIVVVIFSGCGSSSSLPTQQNPATYSFQVIVMAAGNTAQSINYTLTVQ